MKSNHVNRSRAIALAHAQAVILHRQLALRRLRPWERHGLLPWLLRGLAPLKQGARALARAIAGIWSAELVREIAPGKAPQREYEWKQHRDLIRWY